MNASVLAQLLAQAADAGTDLATLRAIAEEAGELGARRALDRLGLSDERAQGDVRELRALIAAWREAKTSALKAAAGWCVKMLLALLLVGVAVKTGFGAWLR